MNQTTLRYRHHCVYSLSYHLVLATKYRHKCLTNELLQVIEQSVKDRCASRDGDLIEFNGEADHVHVLLSLPPHIAISEFVNALKTNTFRVLKRDFSGHLEKFFTAPCSGAEVTAS